MGGKGEVRKFHRRLHCACDREFSCCLYGRIRGPTLMPLQRQPAGYRATGAARGDRRASFTRSPSVHPNNKVFAVTRRKWPSSLTSSSRGSPVGSTPPGVHPPPALLAHGWYTWCGAESSVGPSKLKTQSSGQQRITSHNKSPYEDACEANRIQAKIPPRSRMLLGY